MNSLSMTQWGAISWTEQRLLEAVDVLEGRLRYMGLDGDCAYERAMSNLSHELLEDRKKRSGVLTS